MCGSIDRHVILLVLSAPSCSCRILPVLGVFHRTFNCAPLCSLEELVAGPMSFSSLQENDKHGTKSRMREVIDYVNSHIQVSKRCEYNTI